MQLFGPSVPGWCQVGAKIGPKVQNWLQMLPPGSKLDPGPKFEIGSGPWGQIWALGARGVGKLLNCFPQPKTARSLHEACTKAVKSFFTNCCRSLTCLSKNAR